MNVTIDHPTGRDNFSEVTIGELTVWFSYRTPVGFMFPGYGRVTRQNEWGPTTGRHLNWIDGGSKANRWDGVTFGKMLDEIELNMTRTRVNAEHAARLSA